MEAARSGVEEKDCGDRCAIICMVMDERI